MTKTAADQQTIVLIPAYQPGEALLASTNALLKTSLLIVVIDDGSELEYQDIFRQLDNRVHLLRHRTNSGKGASLKTGYKYIRDTYNSYVVVTADADGQHDTKDIEKLSLSYHLHPHTLLLGVRTFESNTVPLRSKFGNTLTRNIFSLLTKKRLDDTQTGLRAFDETLTDFMIAIPGEQFEYEMNVLLACSRENVPMIKLPIQTIYENNNQSSHFDPIRDSLSIYKQVFKFASSSLLSFCIDFGLFVLLLHVTKSWSLASSVTFANVASRLTSACCNFTINRYFIFKHRGSFIADAVHYALLASIVLFGNTIFLNFLMDIGAGAYLAKLATEVIFFSLSYIVQKNYIFVKKEAYQT